MPLSVTQTVHPIHFSDISGQEFERLVFATLLRMYAWHTLDWHGQVGSDGGRDIIGARDDSYGQCVTVVVACANWKKFNSSKGKSDINKFVKACATPPHEVILIAGSSVSADIKKTVTDHARSRGISETQVWSGQEFEERLRFHADSVLQRFFKGEALPDEANALRAYVRGLDPTTESEAGELIARLFRRPAFMTPIFAESSLPAFRQALTDTIEALNIGIWRDREGAIIDRIPSGPSFTNATAKAGFAKCVKALNSLRISFDNGLRSKKVQPCGCGQANCPTFFIDRAYAERLERERQLVLSYANDALSALGVSSI